MTGMLLVIVGSLPALLLFLILALGRYPGVRQLEEARRRLSRTRRTRHGIASPPPRPGLVIELSRAGVLIARSLAKRGPPAAAHCH